MSCGLQAVVDGYKQYLIGKSTAEWSFKRGFIEDWIASMGRTGNQVHGIHNYSKYDEYSDADKKLLIDRLGFDQASLENTIFKSGVKYIQVGLGFGRLDPRTTYDVDPYGYGDDEYFPKYSLAEPYTSIFKTSLNEMNADFPHLSELTIVRQYTGRYDTHVSPEHAKSVALSRLKISAHPYILETKDSAGLIVELPALVRNALIGSFNFDNHLAGTETTTNIDTFNEFYDNGWDDGYYTGGGGGYVCIARRDETTRIVFPSNIPLFDADTYYDGIETHWNDYKSWTIGEDLIPANYELNKYRYAQTAFEQIIANIMPQADWLISPSRITQRHGGWYDIDYNKYMKASPQEIAAIVSGLIHVYVSVRDSSGFLGIGGIVGKLLTAIVFVIVTFVYMIFKMFIIPLFSFIAGVLGTFFSGGNVGVGIAAATVTSMVLNIVVDMIVFEIGKIAGFNQNQMAFLGQAGQFATIAGGVASLYASSFSLEGVYDSSGTLTGATSSFNLANVGLINLTTAGLSTFIQLQAMFYDPTRDFANDDNVSDEDVNSAYMASMYDDGCDSIYYNYDNPFNYDTMVS